MSKTEGEKLREAIDAVASPAEYAKALNMTASAASRHFDVDTFKPRMWLRVKEGLRLIGGDHTLIRKDPTVMARERPDTQSRDLTPLVTGWAKDDLRVLYDIITATDQERRDLAFFIRGKIA